MIDQIDLEIIHCLKNNSRLQWKQIGEMVHMTGQAVANRIQRLEALGIIEGYTIKVNEAKLGNESCCFITVRMNKKNHKDLEDFLQTRDEVKEAHRVSGQNCFILKVHFSNNGQLNELLDEILVFGQYQMNISIRQCK